MLQIYKLPVPEGVKLSGFVEGRRAYLAYIEVRPTLRRNGIATKVVQSFEDWARSKGADFIIIDAYKTSCRFWYKLGFTLEDNFPVINGIKQDYKLGTKSLS
jgi:GNAT superfamily N-acetyltransferase